MNQTTKIVLGLLLGFLIGFGCRWLDIPVPAPPQLVGALLVLSVTIGYLAADRLLKSSPRPPAAQTESRSPRVL